MFVCAELSGTGVVATRRAPDPEDVRIDRMAAGDAGRGAQAAGTRPVTVDARGGCRGVACSGEGRGCAYAIRRALQALGASVLRALARSIGAGAWSAITRTHLQDYVELRIAAGKAPSTVRNAILPLRAIYRRAHHRDEVTKNPTVGLQLPANRSQRDPDARPEEDAALITRAAEEVSTSTAVAGSAAATG